MKKSTSKCLYQWKHFSIEDLPLILHHQPELYSQNFKNMKFDPPFYANIKQWYTDGIRYFHCYSNLLFTDQDQLIGFYLYQWNVDTVYLMQMYVDQKFRGKGYGTILLRHYEQAGKNQKAASSFLHASKINSNAVSFYERNGYITVNQELDEQGCIRYLMFKPLYS